VVVPKKGTVLGKGENAYTVIAQIGQGSQARVYTAYNNFKKQVRALKWVGKYTIGQSHKDKVKKLYAEAKLMRNLMQHPHDHIVQYFGGISDQTNLCMVLEYVNLGSLKSFVQMVGGLTEYSMAPLIKGILSGLAHIHDLGILHLDIKAENVLIDNDCVVKLTDFGVAIRAQDAERMASTITSTACFAAPEMGGGIPSTASDIWSVGATAIELFTGEAPSDLIGKVSARRERPSGSSQQFARFLRKCLVIDASHRHSAQELLDNDEWIPMATSTRHRDFFLQRFYRPSVSDETLLQMIKNLGSDGSDSSDSSDRSAEIVDDEPAQTEDDEKKEARQSPSPSYAASDAHMTVDDRESSSADRLIVDVQPDAKKDSAKKPQIRPSDSARRSNRSVKSPRKTRKRAGTSASQTQTGSRIGHGRSLKSYHSQKQSVDPKEVSARIKNAIEQSGHDEKVFTEAGHDENADFSRKTLDSVRMWWFSKHGWSRQDVRNLYIAAQIEISPEREEEISPSKRGHYQTKSSRRRGKNHKRTGSKSSWKRKEKGRK